MTKELVSEAAQTAYRDGETQFLKWDITVDPTQNPDKFPGGRGLWYPIIYDPAWPVHIAARKKVVPAAPQAKESEVGSYALTGMTLRECERRPIKKTLIFPHRNTALPFRQPIPKVVKDPIYEPCETLNLTAVEELELRIAMMKSILDQIPPHDPEDKNARELAIRKALHLGHASKPYPGPPISQARKYRMPKPKGGIKVMIDVAFCDVVTVDVFFREGPG